MKFLLHPEADVEFAGAVRYYSESLFGNYEGCRFRGKGWMARRDEGEYPWWIFD